MQKQIEESSLQVAERRLAKRLDEQAMWRETYPEKRAMYDAQIEETRSAIAEVRRQMAGDVEPKPEKVKPTRRRKAK